MKIQRVRSPSARSGLTLIEVSISAIIVALLMMASSMAFIGSIKTATHARDLTESGIFLETVMQDITAVPYSELLILDGNEIFDHTDEDDSNYRVDLGVALLEIDLVQVHAALVDLSTDRQLIRLTSLRGRR